MILTPPEIDHHPKKQLSRDTGFKNVALKNVAFKNIVFMNLVLKG